MTSRDFVYWLQGYFEISGAGGGLNTEQTECVRKHLALVFKHEIDPSMGPPEHQAELDKLHNPRPEPTPIQHLDHHNCGGGHFDTTLVRC